MGVDSNAYVGPFAVCKNEEVEQQVTVRACTRKECLKYGKSPHGTGINFCQTCGAPIGEVEQKRTGWKVHSWELFEEIQNILCTIGTEGDQFRELNEGGIVDVWINNSRKVDVGQVQYDPRRDSFAIVPDPEDAEKSIQAFKEKCAEGIAKLIEAYGEENVEIKWGFLGWLS